MNDLIKLNSLLKIEPKRLTFEALASDILIRGALLAKVVTIGWFFEHSLVPPNLISVGL